MRGSLRVACLGVWPWLGLGREWRGLTKVGRLDWPEDDPLINAFVLSIGGAAGWGNGDAAVARNGSDGGTFRLALPAAPSLSPSPRFCPCFPFLLSPLFLVNNSHHTSRLTATVRTLGTSSFALVNLFSSMSVMTIGAAPAACAARRETNPIGPAPQMTSGLPSLRFDLSIPARATERGSKSDPSS